MSLDSARRGAPAEPVRSPRAAPFRTAALLRSPSAWLCLVSVALMLVGTPTAWLEFDRSAVAAGEVWRLLTGHLVHFSWEHLAWDAVVLLALGVLVEHHDRLRAALGFGMAAVAIPAAVAVFQPELETYRGLSGLASTAFAALLAAKLGDARRAGRRRELVLLALVAVGFGAKLGYELLAGSSFFVDSTEAGFVPVPLAHAVGAAFGALAYSWRSASSGSISAARQAG